jgi:hypothetical protein
MCYTDTPGTKKLEIKYFFLSDTTYRVANNIKNDGQQVAHKTERENFIRTKNE